MTIQQLPSKNWRAVAYLGKDPRGSAIRKSFTHPDKMTAIALAAAYEAQHKNVVDRLSFREAMRRFLRAKESFIAASTFGDYESRYRAMLAAYPAFCKKQIHTITAHDIRELIADMQRVKAPLHRFNRKPKALSPKTIKNYIGFISGVFKNEGIPFPSVDLPRKEVPDIYVPTDAEIRILIDAVRGTDLYVPVLLAAFGPLRRGEVCALEFPRDFHENVIHVREAIGRDGKGKNYRKEPKTPTSNRFIEMPPEVIDAIKEQGYVTQLTPGKITSRFEHVLKKAGLPHFRFHDLRHYCISSLHAQGVPDAYIQKRSGHATDNILKKVYRHTLADREAALAEKAVSHFQSVLLG